MIIPTSITLRSLVEQLAQADYITPETATEITDSIEAETQRAEKPTPWYLQAVIGIAAWLAAVPFIGFLFSTGFLDSPASAILAGSIFCLIAVITQNFVPQSLFIGQLALAFSLAGQILLIGGIGDETENIPVTALAAIILEFILIAVYPNALHRFLSTLIIPAATLVLLFELDLHEVVHGLIILLGVGVIIIWESEPYLAVKVPENVYQPIGYGIVISLFYGLLLSISNIFEFLVINSRPVNDWWLSSIGLLLLLLGLEYLILTSSQLKVSPLVLGLTIVATIIILVPTVQAPGIAAAVLVLIQGFHRRNALLLGLAATFLTLFLIFFYYNLALTLLTKSFILMGIGLASFSLRLLLIKWFETSNIVTPNAQLEVDA